MLVNKLKELTYADVRYGDVVRIHPACDWFMRGITQAECTSIRKDKKYFKAYWPRLGNSRLRFVLTERDVLEVVAVGLPTALAMSTLQKT